MAKDRFKGSADSTIGNEMLRWQGKAVILFSVELFKILPCNFLKKLLLQTTTFSSAFVYIRNYFKTPSTQQLHLAVGLLELYEGREKWRKTLLVSISTLAIWIFKTIVFYKRTLFFCFHFVFVSFVWLVCGVFFSNLLFKVRNATKFLFLSLNYFLLFPAQKEKVFAVFWWNEFWYMFLVIRVVRVRLTAQHYAVQ